MNRINPMTADALSSTTMSTAAFVAGWQRTAICVDDTVLIAQDASSQRNLEAEAQLDRMGIPACLIPIKDGGTFDNMPELMRLLQAVCSKDLSLGLSYILTTLMAVTNVWIAGNPQQRARLADLIARQKNKVAIAYHELDHGNDLNANTLSATPVENGFLLNGKKQVLNNIARAGAVVVQARTASTEGAASHSLFFVEIDQLGSGVQILPRYRTVGVKSSQLHGIAFTDCFIPDTCLLGQAGHGFSYASKAFQITRALLPGITLGPVAYALNLAIGYAGQRHLYGKPIAKLPFVSAVLAEARLELYIANLLTHTVAACLHQVPAQMSVYASLCKFIVPKKMRQVLQRLSSMLGARFYVCEGPYALFEKIVRDYAVMSFGHASSLTCQALIAPQLALILRNLGKTMPTVADMRAMNDGSLLPDFDPDKLRLTNVGNDVLLNSLLLWPEVIATLREQKIICDDGYKEWITIAAEMQLTLNQLTTQSSNQVIDEPIVERYALLQCIAVVFNDWAYPAYGGVVEIDEEKSALAVSALRLLLCQISGNAFYISAETERKIIASCGVSATVIGRF
ncbi:acyl-CoA dehydrogenase [Glaciimonas sp. GG7]